MIYEKVDINNTHFRTCGSMYGESNMEELLLI